MQWMRWAAVSTGDSIKFNVGGVGSGGRGQRGALTRVPLGFVLVDDAAASCPTHGEIYPQTISDPVPFFPATTNLQTSREFSVLRVDTNPLAFTPSTPINLHLIHIAHHGQLSRAAQGHWHGRSIYPAKPLVGEKVTGHPATIGVATSWFSPGIASVLSPTVGIPLLTVLLDDRLLSAILVSCFPWLSPENPALTR
jgi:hypothetical protein